MKARKVKRLDPSGTLADNAQRIVHARLDELCAFGPKVADPANISALHAMRIAAKRLRYVLEATADPCFGPYAQTAAKRAKELQDLLGEIHDCDIQLPRVEALAASLRDSDAAELGGRAGDADDLDPALAARLPHSDAWQGLTTLEIYLRARRDLLFARFTAFWLELERDAFRARLEYAINERPEPATTADVLPAASGPPAPSIPSTNGAEPEPA